MVGGLGDGQGGDGSTFLTGVSDVLYWKCKAGRGLGVPAGPVRTCVDKRLKVDDALYKLANHAG